MRRALCCVALLFVLLACDEGRARPITNPDGVPFKCEENPCLQGCPPFGPNCPPQNCRADEVVRIDEDGVIFCVRRCPEDDVARCRCDDELQNSALCS